MGNMKTTIFDLSRAGLPTVKWSQIVAESQLDALHLPIGLGVMNNATGTIVNSKIVNTKDELNKYYKRLVNAYGSDVPVIATEAVNIERAVTISLDGGSYSIESDPELDIGADELLDIIHSVQTVLSTGESSILKFKVGLDDTPIITEVM